MSFAIELKVPVNYLESILLSVGIEKDITLIFYNFISKSSKNLHFIIDEKEINFSKLLELLCSDLKSKADPIFKFKVGQKICSLVDLSGAYEIIKFRPNDYELKKLGAMEEALFGGQKPKKNLAINKYNNQQFENKKYIPLSECEVTQSGLIKKRITAFKNKFKAEFVSDFSCNEKLLVIGNRNQYLAISKDLPACFVYEIDDEKENRTTKIEYNSPILPKITILKNINLLDNYQQQEINGEQVVFNTCIFIGSSKFENSIATIRNYYHQKRFTKIVFIGEKDFKLDLGNNQLPLRWCWTIPEIIFFKGKRSLRHGTIVIPNEELERTITEFYQAIREIESKHTVSLKSIFRFIRRLYYDWTLKQETVNIKLQQIQQEFDSALNQLLIETLGNIYQDLEFDAYQKPLSKLFAEIIKSIQLNSKYEYLKSYQTQIHQLVLPSFLCNVNKRELNEIAKESKQDFKAKSLHNISQLQNAIQQHLKNKNREYYSLTANDEITEILSYSKSEDLNAGHHKIITSIYGSGKIEKLIERLGIAKSEYDLLLYSIEEKALRYHFEKYIYELNKEYISQDRFEISGVEFNDNYYQFSNFDELLEYLASTKYEVRDVDNYQIIFTDNSKMKLPSTKIVLNIQSNKKEPVLVEDLNIGDKVLIYSNPDKKLLRVIMELEMPELMKKADEYSSLWKTCLYNYHQKCSLAEPLYQQLVKNHLSVSEATFGKYLEGEVMFPRRFSDLTIIAKTINDPRISFDFLKNTIKPKIDEFRGKEIEYGFKLSNSINQFIISEDVDEFISRWLTTAELKSIVSQIPMRTIKDIVQITKNIDD